MLDSAAGGAPGRSQGERCVGGAYRPVILGLVTETGTVSAKGLIPDGFIVLSS